MRVEAVVAAEGGGGLVGEDVAEQGFLHFARVDAWRPRTGPAGGGRARRRACRRPCAAEIAARDRRRDGSGCAWCLASGRHARRQRRNEAHAAQRRSPCSAATARVLVLRSRDAVCGIVRAASASPSARCRSKNSSTRRRYSSPADVQGLVVLGALDQPEFLRLAGAVEQRLGHLRLDVGVGLAVDHQQRPRRQARQRTAPGAGSGSARSRSICRRPTRPIRP